MKKNKIQRLHKWNTNNIEYKNANNITLALTSKKGDLAQRNGFHIKFHNLINPIYNQRSKAFTYAFTKVTTEANSKTKGDGIYSIIHNISMWDRSVRTINER